MLQKEKQTIQLMKTAALSLVFSLIVSALSAQTVTITGPTTCALANTNVPYTVTVDFTTILGGITPAQEFCICNYVIFSTRDNNGVGQGDIIINGVNRGSKVALGEINCAQIVDVLPGEPGYGMSDVRDLQAPGSTKLTWIYNISIRWYTPQGNSIGGTLKAEYKCASFNAMGTITTELFPRKPTLVTSPVNCATTRLSLGAAGNLSCLLGSSVGYQVEESTNGGTTWTVIFNALAGVPRLQNYSPANPTVTRMIRARMYAITAGPVTTYSAYSDIKTILVDNRPTLIDGPTYFPAGNHTAFYTINQGNSNNVFSFGATGGGVNVSFLTSPSSTSVLVNVPATSTGGYFTVEAKGNAGCGAAYSISKGAYVAATNGLRTGDGTVDRADNEQDKVANNEVTVNYYDRKLDVMTGNAAEKVVSIFRIDGKIMLRQTFSDTTLSVPLSSDFKPGIYIVNVLCNGKLTNKKIVINE